MNFDRLARTYIWLERLAFGGALQKCRTGLLDRVGEVRNALIVGEGDGRFLEVLLETHPHAVVTVVDSSERMLELARSRVGETDRVNFLCCDVREFDCADSSFDLIVTHFVLDCFVESDVEAIIQRLSGRLSPEGIWLWSDFAVPECGWMRLPARMVIWGLYRFFRMTTGLDAGRLVSVDRFFLRSGLQRVDEKAFLAGLLQTKLWKKEGEIDQSTHVV